MNIQIEKINSQNLHQLNKLNRKFMVESKLALSMDNGHLTYSVVPVTPYEKEIPIDEIDASTYIDHDEKTIFLAFTNGKLAGQIEIITWWNQFAYINDFIVDTEFRRLGVGKSLMAEAVRWSKEKRFPGIMLETQDDNVSACKLYQSCGFVLGGFDKYTYTNVKPNEIALYWYLIF